jgi:hypothetical protein
VGRVGSHGRSRARCATTDGQALAAATAVSQYNANGEILLDRHEDAGGLARLHGGSCGSCGDRVRGGYGGGNAVGLSVVVVLLLLYVQ